MQNKVFAFLFLALWIVIILMRFDTFAIKFSSFTIISSLNVRNTARQNEKEIQLIPPAIQPKASLLLPATAKPKDTRPKQDVVAIAMGIVSTTKVELSKAPFFKSFLPSFCKTSSIAFRYEFYFAYDYTDKLFIKAEYRRGFESLTATMVAEKCPDQKMGINWIECSHQHNPAWAQNDAVWTAYLDEIDYFYRVNDDSVLQTPRWTELFIDALGRFSPPNVGVVGPTHHGGNHLILTYDFTHRTHLDVFGFHYPRLFTDWWADDWITKVYMPGRSLKLPAVKLLHTIEFGQRYKHKHNKAGLLNGVINRDKKVLLRYITAKQRGFSPPDATLVVAMGLSGNAPRYTYGAVRNAQLMPLIYPGWTLRVYFDASVPLPVRGKLQDLGAQLVEVKDASTPARLWPLRALEDRTLREVLVRDAHARINEREAAAVREWRASNFSVHTMRDTPAHAQLPLVRGLMAARPATLPAVHRLLQDSPSDAEVAKRLTQLFGNSLLAHDSVTCRSDAKPFPLKKTDFGESVGLHFDPYGDSDANELKAIKSYTKPICGVASTTHRTTESSRLTSMRASSNTTIR